jgi:nucleoside-triphosphatase
MISDSSSLTDGTQRKSPRPGLLLVTGPPGVGKTTVVLRVASALRGLRIGGFTTEEIREGGRRVGFRIVPFRGEDRVMAHVRSPGRERVGRYGVDVGAVEAVCEGALAPDPDVDLYLVDEIGNMECLAPRFVDSMRVLLEAGRPVVATVALKGAGFIREVKEREGALLWHVSVRNRDSVAERIVEWLAAR